METFKNLASLLITHSTITDIIVVILKYILAEKRNSVYLKLQYN